MLLWGDPGSTSFVLTAIGHGVVVVGVYVVANVWKEPHYDVILAWDAEAMPADWEAGRPLGSRACGNGKGPQLGPFVSEGRAARSRGCWLVGPQVLKFWLFADGMTN